MVVFPSPNNHSLFFLPEPVLSTTFCRPIQEISISTSFEALGLRPELVRAVTDSGYTQPTPVQKQAVPIILNRSDAIVGAQTGTGKTASFAMPILQLLADKAPARPQLRALTLTPTRELAVQVEKSFRTYGRYLPLKSTTVFGGVNINPQIHSLRRGVDILVATPGRLLDHVRNRTVDLSKIEVLVLDEADRMLDMGFLPDIRRILEALPKGRQNLLFSATYSREIRQFAGSILNAPEKIPIEPKKVTAELVKQVVHPVDKGNKRALLSSLIKSGNWHQVLVFTRTKHGANRLGKQLESDGISAAAIHGNKSQGARTRALEDFKRGKVRALVATDIAARGLDIKELPYVVNYELPNVPEDYVHRIGRTGRAGSNGIAMSLVCGEEKSLLANIERLTGKRIESVTVTGFESGPEGTGNQKQTTENHPARRHPDAQRRVRSRKEQGAGRGSAKARKPGKRSGGASLEDLPKTSERDAWSNRPGKSKSTAARRRRKSGKGKRGASDVQARSPESAPGSRKLHKALRAVAGFFGGAQ